MSLIAKKSSGGESQFEILEEGTHAAICTQLIDIGPQEVEWQGVKKLQDKVKLRFEVPAERVQWVTKEGKQDEGPKVIWATYTNSLSDNAKLRAHLESWRGRTFTDEELAGFDLKNILDKPCMLTVVHREYNGKRYANIAMVGKLMKGLNPQREGELIYFDFDDHSQAEFDALSEWLQSAVKAGQANRTHQVAVPGYDSVDNSIEDDDSIPF